IPPSPVDQLPHQGPSGRPRWFWYTSPFCSHAPCGTLPRTKLQPGKGFEVVFRSRPAGEVPPRPFGTGVALWGFPCWHRSAVSGGNSGFHNLRPSQLLSPRGGTTMALVQKSVEASVGTITLDHREKHNALSGALIADLLESLTGLVKSGARVVVLRAPRGAKVWSARHDVRELPIWPRATGRSASAPAGRVLCAVPRSFVPSPTERLRLIMKESPQIGDQRWILTRGPTILDLPR